MTLKPASRVSFGRAPGETARLIGKLHHRALADLDSKVAIWMSLTLLQRN